MRIADGISLDHLDRMTDSTGMIQHAIYSVPRRDSGYCTDDNSRALRLCVRLWNERPGKRMLKRVTTYLSFLQHACSPQGGFHNFLGYDRRWLDAVGCGDSQGQAIRALAEVLGSDLPGDYRLLAREMIEDALPSLARLQDIRAQAYLILAWGHLCTRGVEDIEPLEGIAWSAARQLAGSFHRNQKYDWQWFEPRMTYANAVLPHALFIAAKRWPDDALLQTAEASFAFLDHQTTSDGRFCPIGNLGWYPYQREKALYDQQPVEAATMAEAALAAFDLLGKPAYLGVFQRAHAWFHGRNSLGLSLLDIDRGACCDGLEASGVNRNQGAESTLAYLWVEVNRHVLQRTLGENRKDAVTSA